MSIHTFELSKSFGKGENGYLKYQEFLDRAQTDCQKEGYKIFYDRSNNPGYKCHRLLKFMGLGIQVHLIANHNDYYIKFIVNLQKVLVADGLVKIINESNAQEAIEMVNWQLSSWLGDEFEIDRLRLSRVDICSNIDVGSAELQRISGRCIVLARQSLIRSMVKRNMEKDLTRSPDLLPDPEAALLNYPYMTKSGSLKKSVTQAMKLTEYCVQNTAFSM